MANKRIKDLTQTATTLASDDYVAIDGSSNGTRKIVKGDLVNDISSQVAGTYLDEANNLSDVASKDTSKLNMEIPDVGTAPNEVPLNGMLGSMAYQSSESVSAAKLEVESTTGTATTQALTVTDGSSTKFVVQEDGLVGVGTSSPSAAYKLDVNGDIHTNQILRMTRSGNFALYPSTSNIVYQLEQPGMHWFKTDSQTVATIDASANLNVSLGNLVFGTSGKGIDFGAVASGTGTVTPTTGGLLDDFETGTWSPVIGPSSGSFATATTYVYFAKYTKVGNLVTANCYIRTDGTLDTTGGTGSVRINGLPFTSPSANDFISINVGYAFNWSAAPAGGYVSANTNRILLTKRASSVTGNLITGSVSDLSTAGGAKNEIMLSVTYQTS